MACSNMLNEAKHVGKDMFKSMLLWVNDLPSSTTSKFGIS